MPKKSVAKSTAKPAAKSAAGKKSASKPAAGKKSTLRKARPLKLETTETLYDLTPAEVKALSRPREGFAAHIDSLLDLYTAEIDELRIRDFDIAALRAHEKSAQALVAIEAAANKYAEMVRETRLLHDSQLWTGLLEIYAKAQAVSRTNEAVARGIADFTKFMKYGPRKKKTSPA